MSLNGYDISNNQGNIDNTQVPGDFVIIKATEGNGYTDPNCDANFQQAKSAGKLLGVYHFARPDGNGPIDEANWFVSQIQGYLDGTTLLVLDWETEPKGNVSWVRQFGDRVFELTGVRVVVYMSASVVNDHDWSSVYNDYALWVAQYGANNPVLGYDVPATPPDVNWNPQAPYLLWQYTSNDHQPNWNGALDCSVFYGDKNTWLREARDQRNDTPPTPPAPAPVPDPQPTPVPPVVVPPVVTPPVIVPPVPTPVEPPVVVTPTPEPIQDQPINKEENNMNLLSVSKAIAGGLVAVVLTYLTKHGVNFSPIVTDAANTLLLAMVSYVVAHVAVYFAPKSK